MVSLKSFLHYFSHPQPATPVSADELLKIQRPGAGVWRGGEY